jgi:hypothetical protein
MLGMEVTHLVRRLDDARGASGWRWLALSPFPLYLLAAGAAGSSVGDLVLGLPSSLALLLIMGCASTAVCRTVSDVFACHRIKKPTSRDRSNRSTNRS